MLGRMMKPESENENSRRYRPRWLKGSSCVPNPPALRLDKGQKAELLSALKAVVDSVGKLEETKRQLLPNYTNEADAVAFVLFLADGLLETFDQGAVLDDVTFRDEVVRPLLARVDAEDQAGTGMEFEYRRALRLGYYLVDEEGRTLYGRTPAMAEAIKAAEAAAHAARMEEAQIEMKERLKNFNSRLATPRNKPAPL
jgi:hypothetical protein